MTDPFEKARSLLTPPVANARPWSMLGAAALAAFAATLMAGVMVLGPGISFEDSASAETPFEP